MVVRDLNGGTVRSISVKYTAPVPMPMGNCMETLSRILGDYFGELTACHDHPWMRREIILTPRRVAVLFSLVMGWSFGSPISCTDASLTGDIRAKMALKLLLPENVGVVSTVRSCYQLIA